jgi:hypothetical protein
MVGTVGAGVYMHVFLIFFIGIRELVVNFINSQLMQYLSKCVRSDFLAGISCT